VTVSDVFQSSGVKVRTAGDTDTAPGSLLVSRTVTSPAGMSSSFIV
jgi:hypothetical protein